jgi:hypothetical protein
MVPIKNPFEGFLSPRLLLLGIATMKPIFGLELTKKACLAHLKSLVVDVFLVNLSYNELEVKDYGIVELECFSLKPQKPKLVRLDQMWTENGKWKVKQEDLKYYPVAKCCLVQPFVELSI